MKNKIKYLPISILTLTTAMTGAGLLAPAVNAATTASSDASVTVSTACAFSSAADTQIALSLSAGLQTNTEGSGERNISVSCNSSNALTIQAVGVAPSASSPETPVEGNTALYNAEQNASIPTSAPTSSAYWAFKVSTAGASSDATVTNSYSNYSAVPSTRTPVVTFSAAATPAAATTITLRTDYQVLAGSDQAAGSYSGGVKYIIVDAS